MTMFPFLAIFITFCLILAYYIRRGDAAQQKAEDAFWEKERRSNAVPKKDISKLDYINIPFEKIPAVLDTSAEKSFFALKDKPMVNFTGISNTDLKLTYGTANITALSQYDTNFTEFVALLPEYTSELSEAGYTDTAEMLLEFAVNANADSRKIYTQLAAIYQEKGESDKLYALHEHAERLPESTKKSIQSALSSMH